MRVEYGIRAVMDLVENHGRGLVRSSDIARRRVIPEAFLDQVLMDLRKAGVVRSLRGPSGGHELARPPTSLSLGEVVRSLGEEPLAVACMRDDHCIVSDSCVLQDVWCELAESYQEILNGTLIIDLVRREAERKARDTYHI
jgi:Rrf2 family protein